MKRKILEFFALLCTSLIFAQESIRETIRSFDEDLMKAQSTTAQVTIGFITYADSNTCGTIVPFLQDEIKQAAESTRRISIVKTTELSEYEQAGIATRGLTMGMSSKAKKYSEKNYILDGTYCERGENIELLLTMHDAEGNVFGKKTAIFEKSLAIENNLTLFPSNQKTAKTIQEDFEKIQTEEEKSKRQKTARIGLSASMLDSGGSLVNILHPNDIVRFKISADSDCYISILCIDANGVKTWLPLSNNFLEADTPRLFPDIAGAVLRVANDGVFGAEQVVIYACSEKEGLPSQTESGKYSSQDLHLIMKKQQNAKKNKSYGTGTFKITYTIMEK